MIKKAKPKNISFVNAKKILYTFFNQRNIKAVIKR
jgi:hypothetical protein